MARVRGIVLRRREAWALRGRVRAAVRPARMLLASSLRVPCHAIGANEARAPRAARDRSCARRLHGL